MDRRALLLGLATLGAACGPPPLPPPPPAPRIASALELIPSDLDIVARLDMARMKAALGGLTPELLSRDVLARTSGTSGDEPDDLIVASLLKADVVYLGYRPSPLWVPLDRVLALQGRFDQLVKTPSGFSSPIDLGGDFRYWDKQSGRTLPRTGVARLYAQGTLMRAFVSEAEIDAVERALDGLAGPHRLVPPEEGALSLAARPALLGRLAGGSLRELLGDAKELELVIDLDSDAAELKLTLITATPEQADELVTAGKLALSHLLGERAARAKLGAVGDRVALSMRMTRGELAPAFACLRGASAGDAGCPW